YQTYYVVDTIRRDWIFMGLLGAGSGNVTGSQEPAQLVLCRNAEDPCAGTMHFGVNGGGAQELWIAQLYFFARGSKVVVAGYPMHGRWGARHNGQIVGIGEGRHLAAAKMIGAPARQKCWKARHKAARHGVIQIGGFTAVDRDRHGRSSGQAIWTGIY